MKIITDVEERISEDNWRVVLLPTQYFQKTIWKDLKVVMDEYTWMCGYKVHKDKREYARELSIELYELLAAGKSISSKPVVACLDKLKSIRHISWEESSNLVKWDTTAELLPGDIAGRYKTEITNIISEKLSGNILEAMCGFNSYISPGQNRHVTAHDYSEKMLKRYEYPERTRIMFDLNTLPEKRFTLSDQSFDAISFVKGYKYVKSPVNMFQEWHRLLKPKGILLFVESTTAGYTSMTLRKIRAEKCREELQYAGFHESVVTCLPFDEGDGEKLLLFEARK